MQLHHKIDRIHGAGAELVVVGSGTPNFVAGFRELTGFQGPLYCDPTLSAYRAAGLRRGVMRILNPLSAGYAVRALVRGNFQGRTQGDATQQGGVLVITPSSPGGRIVFEHISKVAGDNAPAEEVVSALEHAVAPPPHASAQT